MINETEKSMFDVKMEYVDYIFKRLDTCFSFKDWYEQTYNSEPNEELQSFMNENINEEVIKKIKEQFGRL